MVEKCNINELKNKLDKSIINGEDYSVIYKLSTELDKMVADFYRTKSPNTLDFK